MIKIIQNDKVIDVVRHPHFVRFLSSGHVAITDKTSAQGVIGSDEKTIYSFKHIPKQKFKTVQFAEVTPEEFNRLQGLLNSNQEVSADDSALAEVKRETIKRLSSICKNQIISGFSVELSDNKLYNFRLTPEDQLNLMIIENQLNSGAETFVYHATNMPCKIFMREDMLKIIATFKQHILYHTTYFNAAKQYIKSLTDITKVITFAYGTDISNTVSDVVLKQILKNGDSFK